MTNTTYPFSAVVGQDELLLALLLTAVSPEIGGVLVRGEKGTAKSTAVRALARLLPPVEVTDGCAFGCDPNDGQEHCPAGPHEPRPAVQRPVRLVELPIGTSTDRLVGSLDLERILASGTPVVQPGLLAEAHRGILYVDEVNLLPDHLVDLLLDAAATGTSTVERDGVRLRHGARFQLVGTMNPEEGDLRPQLLDRFGLSVHVIAPADPSVRAEVVHRGLAYEADPATFVTSWASGDEALGRRIVQARALLPTVHLPRRLLAQLCGACARLGVEGLRGDLVMAKTARALAAWEGRSEVNIDDLHRAGMLALAHRRRRGPFDEAGLRPEELEDALNASTPLDPDDEPPSGASGSSTPDPSPRSPNAPVEGSSDTHGAEGEDLLGDAPETGGLRGSAERAPAQPAHGAADAPRHPSAPCGDDPHATSGKSDDPHGQSPDWSDPPRAETEHGDSPSPPSAGRFHASSQKTGERAPANGHDTAASSADAVSLVLPGAVRQAIRLAIPAPQRRAGAGTKGRRTQHVGGTGHSVTARRERPPAEQGSSLAVAATLGAAAVRVTSPPTASARPLSRLRLTADDLRYEQRAGRRSHRIVFLVDASGSMGAKRRMAATKEAVLSLLLDSYQRRDQVGVVTMRGEHAQVLLAPTGSSERAARHLTHLATGGRSPIGAGLDRVRHLLAAASRRDPHREALLVVMTDGRANVSGDEHTPFASALQAAGRLATARYPTLVVDTEQGAVRLGLAGQLAAALGGRCVRLDDIAGQGLIQLVHVALGRAAPGRFPDVAPSSGSSPSVLRRLS